MPTGEPVANAQKTVNVAAMDPDVDHVAGGVTHATLTGSAAFTPDDMREMAAAMSPAITAHAKRNAVIAAVLLAAVLSLPVYLWKHSTLVHEGQGIAEQDKTAEKPVPKKEENGIVVDGVPTTLLKEELGRTILSIEGALVNKTDKVHRVPVLQAQALNTKGKVVKEWIIPVPLKEMDPGMRQTFTYSMPFADEGVVDIAFHFLEDK